MSILYPEKSQLLTSSRWKPVSEIQKFDEILSLDPNSRSIQQDLIQSVERRSYSGKAVKITGRNIDITLTPDHKILTYNRYGNPEWIKAEDLIDSNERFSSNTIPKSAKPWGYVGEEYFVLDALSEKELEGLWSNQSKEYYSKPLYIPMSVWMSFLGIYLSEVNTARRSDISYKVVVSQKKEENIRKISELLAETGLNWNCGYSKKTAIFLCTDLRLGRYLHPLGICYDKYIPEDAKWQSHENVTKLINWFHLGDGTVKRTKRSDGSYHDASHVFSTSEKLIADLHELFVKTGKCGRRKIEIPDKDVMIEGRVIKAENKSPIHFLSLNKSKGIYLTNRFELKCDSVYAQSEEIVKVGGDCVVAHIMSENKCCWLTV